MKKEDPGKSSVGLFVRFAKRVLAIQTLRLYRAGRLYTLQKSYASTALIRRTPRDEDSSF